MADTLTSTQRMYVESARKLLAAEAAGRVALAEHVSATDPDDPWPAAFGAAKVNLGWLLEVIEDLTASK